VFYALIAGGCSKKVTAPPPAASLPPTVEATLPPARSTGILDDTPIWVQFDRALDTTTVDTRTVFLKVDTQRLPISVNWDGATRRIVITPTSKLALFRTHTVELSPEVAAEDGTRLGQSFFWQFRVISLRVPRAPFPADGVGGESPLLTLSWLGTEPAAGTIAYDVFTGADSAAVATRAVSPIAHFTAKANLTPAVRWPMGSRLYWSVRAYNFTTGETLDGKVWHFDTLPADTPIDSLTVPMRDWFYAVTGSGFGGSTYNRFCSGDSIGCGPPVDQNYLRWNYAGLGVGLRLAGAAVVLSPYEAYWTRMNATLGLGSLVAIGNVCSSGQTAPFVKPVGGGVLAAGEVVPGPRVRFASDALAAYIEYAARQNGPDGFSVYASTRIQWVSPRVTFLPQTPPPSLKLYVYRPPAP
jgi:hypothetical protein